MKRNLKLVGADMGGVFTAFIVEAAASGQSAVSTAAAIGGVSCFGAGLISYGKMWYHSLRHSHFSKQLDAVTVPAFNEVVQRHAEFRDAFADIDVLELNDATEDLE